VKAPSRLTVLTAALLVLLPALAILQYRWVGQLRDAARERMQRNLHNAARQFQDSFDSEIARAFVSLQVDTARSSDQYAERYAAWASTTAYPWLVANVYVIDAIGRDLRVSRWDSHTRTFAPAGWDGALEGTRAVFASELAAFTSAGRRPFDRQLLRAHEALLVAPLIHIQFGAPPQPHTLRSMATTFGFTIIELNLAAIKEQLLPALARRHFSERDDDAYRVAVVDASTPTKVVYKSAPEAPINPSRAEVNVPIFAAHDDPILFLARGTARDVRHGADTRNVVLSVIREQRDDRTMGRSRVTNADGGRWRLLAQHERGSLDAAVGDVRQRNLLVSFGILLLMGVSIGLLTLSSRRAQNLAQRQMEFVAGVSHELRTPVAVIRSAAENLSQGVVGDADHVRRYGDAIQVEARRLGEMVERVLHFAGIESGRIARAPIAIEPLVTEAVDAVLAHDPEAFTVDRQIATDLPDVLGDAAALRSAIQNLVANAMKYGGADRWIGIRADVAHEGRHRREVRITVEDHGRGVDPADLPHIFDPFYRGAEATSRQIQGSGLGLALVRRIAEAHRGRVTVVTRARVGSAFTLHLPDATMFHDKPAPLRFTNEAAAG
jgi:signal transduction histidine kinase